MKKIGPITLTLDVKGPVEQAQAVADELLRRVNDLSPLISEQEAMQIILIDMTFEYLKAKGTGKENA